MYLRVLGTAAGGGFPQWNCACTLCKQARSASHAVSARLHASLAVSATGNNWYVLNATPDIRLQIEFCRALHPGPAVRETPLRGVLLTDAELDHTIGLLILREGSALEIYGSSAVLQALEEALPVRAVLKPYAALSWTAVKVGEALLLDNAKLRVWALPLGRKRPRYAAACETDGEWTVGYRLEDAKTGGSVVYAPAVEKWTDELTREIERADCVFVDGTFWSEDEMICAGVGKLSAREMGHIPVGGEEGIAERLSRLPVKRKILVHINNTNPILNRYSREYSALVDKGIEVGLEGMELEV